MTESLFRVESTLSNQNNLKGKVLLRYPIKHKVLIIISSLVMFVVFLLILLGSYSKRIVAIGNIAPSNGVVRIFPSKQGIIKSIKVKEGSVVSKDQVLVELDSQQRMNNNFSTESRLLNELKNITKNIESKNNIESAIIHLDINRIKRQIKIKEFNILSQQKLLGISKERITKEEQTLKRYGILKIDNLLSNTQYELQNDKVLSLLETQEIRILKKSNLYSDIEDLNIQLQLKNEELNLIKIELDKQKFDINRNKIELKSRQQSVILAPVSGRVTAIQSYLGETVSFNKPLMTLIPLNSDYIAILYVPTNSIGSVEINQKVFLKYRAFPYQHYGMHEGRVVEISEAIVSKNGLEIGSIFQDEPLFRIKIRLMEQYLTKNNKKYSLSSGMLLDADIVQESKPIWKWLLEPILGADI